MVMVETALGNWNGVDDGNAHASLLAKSCINIMDDDRAIKTDLKQSQSRSGVIQVEL